MNLKKVFCFATVLCSLLALTNVAEAQGTAFTYQGRLNNNGSAASGSYDVAFTLFATNSSGNAIAGPVTNAAVTVNNGLFTTTVDFGNVFAGGSNWLEIAVSTNHANAFTALSPRQQVTPVPYALSAASLALPAGAATIFSGTNSLLHYDANANFFAGPTAGNLNSSGTYNTGEGMSALANDTTGSGNSANGFAALFSNNTGSFNIANGYQSLAYNTVGTANTALGFQALLNNTTGSNNIGIGYQAGGNLTTGSGNIDIGNVGSSSDTNIIRIGAAQTQTYIAGALNGSGAGLTNLQASQLVSQGNSSGTGNFFTGPSGNPANTGSANSAYGYAALNANGSGSGNAANGYGALYNNTSGSYNLALGYLAGLNITTGSNNIDIGNSGIAGDNNTIRIGTGQTQTYIAGTINGSGLGLSNILSSQLISLGNYYGAGNFFVGPSGNATTSGTYNTANGMAALLANTTGSGNVASGFGALTSNTNGVYNSANGCQALNLNTSGSDNTASGYQALALNSSGSYNVADGYQALFNNLTGIGNSALGHLSLFDNVTGIGNTASGYQALYTNTIGSFNTAAGLASLYQCKSGSNNIAIGYQAAYNYTGSESGNINIGSYGVQGENNIIRIGVPNVHTATYLAGTVYANGVALTSDRNAKENFTPLDPQTVLAKVAALPLMEWNYKADPATRKHVGPMAQDFQAAFGLNGSDDKHISVVDEGGVALAAIQGLNEVVKAKDRQIQTQAAELAELKSRLEKIEQCLSHSNETLK